MGALGVGAVQPVKRNEGETAAVLELVIILRLKSEGRRLVPLAGVVGVLRK